MLIFKKNKNDKNHINELTTIDLNKVVSIDVCLNDEKYTTKFFMGKKEQNINIEISLGIKETNSITPDNVITLIFKMLNGDRYKQTAYVIKKENHLITTQPNDDIQKLEEKRRHIKVDSKLNGNIYAMEKQSHVDISNISIGGVFIKTNYDLFISGVYDLHIVELDMCVKIMLLRQQKDKFDKIEGYGCKFEKISDKDLEKLSVYINSTVVRQREILISRDVYNYF